MAKLFSPSGVNCQHLVFFSILLLLGSWHAQVVQAAMRIDGSVCFVRSNDDPGVSIDVEIADTPEARTQGLMGREVPDFTSGMLFIFERAQIVNFWMRDTPAPLDIIFIAESGEVLNIAHRTTPMSDTIYSSAAPVRYVVEVKEGFAEHFGINPGTRIQWHRL